MEKPNTKELNETEIFGAGVLLITSDKKVVVIAIGKDYYNLGVFGGKKEKKVKGSALMESSAECALRELEQECSFIFKQLGITDLTGFPVFVDSQREEKFATFIVVTNLSSAQLNGLDVKEKDSITTSEDPDMFMAFSNSSREEYNRGLIEFCRKEKLL